MSTGIRIITASALEYICSRYVQMGDIDWYVVGAQDTRTVQLLVCPANILKSSVAYP